MNWIVLISGLVSAIALGGLNAFINMWTNGYDVTSFNIWLVVPAGAFLLGAGAGFGAGLGTSLSNSAHGHSAAFMLWGVLCGGFGYFVYLFVLYQISLPGAPIAYLFDYASELFRSRVLEAGNAELAMGEFGLWAGYASIGAASLGGLGGVLAGDKARRTSTGVAVLPPTLDAAIAIVASVARVEDLDSYMKKDLCRKAISSLIEVWLPDDHDKRRAEIDAKTEAKYQEFFEGSASSTSVIDTLVATFPKREKVANILIVHWCMMIAMADGELNGDEIALIKRIAGGLSVDTSSGVGSFDGAKKQFADYWVRSFENTAKTLLRLHPAGKDKLFELLPNAYNGLRKTAQASGYAVSWGDAAIVFATSALDTTVSILPEIDRKAILHHMQTTKLSDLSSAVSAMEGDDKTAQLPDGFTFGTIFVASVFLGSLALTKIGSATADTFNRMRSELIAMLGGEPAPADAAAS